MLCAMSEMETNANQKVSCVANYAYDASEPDELTIRPGDLLRDVERLPGGWWRGELRGRRGMFPDNFVSVVNEASNTSRSGGVQGRCRAVFSYQPANPDELPLCVGDVLEVLGEVEEGWWQGRRQGRVGVFPSNFVVMLDPPPASQPALSPYEPAPALPPKPVKELCRVLFPYSAVNEDELTLSEGDIVTIVSKDAPDRGWWRGELHGRTGLFPDNFVQLLPPVTTTVEEKKPDRPPIKTTAPTIYPILNKYSEKTASVKELTTSKISTHKENTLTKETSSQSTITNSNKNESEKLIHSETVTDGTLDGQVKKPPVPLKKSPTPTSGVGGLFSGLKSKMLSSTDKEKSSSTVSSSSTSSSNNSGEWDKTDGGALSRTQQPNNANINTFDHVERNTLLSDPRAGRVKAPRRRPPSQAFRDDTPQQIGLSNGHEVPTTTTNTLEKEKEREKTAAEKATEEIKPRTREWEKHRAPWMEELKLNQAKKTSYVENKSRSVSSGSESGVASKAGTGSTDRILECGLEEKRSSSHSMEMSKSTSSITNRMSVLESFEETKVRHSLDSKKEPTAPEPTKPVLSSPTAAGRTLTSMLEEIKKPVAPSPPLASVRTTTEQNNDKSPNNKTDKVDTDVTKPSAVFERNDVTKPNAVFDRNDVTKPSAVLERNDVTKPSAVFERNDVTKPSAVFEKNDVTKPSTVFERTSTLERIHKEDKRDVSERSLSSKNTMERLMQSFKTDKTEKAEGTDALIVQLNNRISNLEKLLEVQNTMFKTAIDDLTSKLKQESEKRQALQTEVEKLAHCVTQV